MGNVKGFFFPVLVALLATSTLSLGKAYPSDGPSHVAWSASQEKVQAYLPLLTKSYIDMVPPFGVQMDSLGDPTALRLAHQMGAYWVRTGLSWATLEPKNTSADNFNWATYDAGLAAAAQDGLAPLVMIKDNPSWAAETSCGPISPSHFGDFAAFLQALVTRYSQSPYNVHYWELYNEPDNTDYANRSWLGGCWGGHAEEYAKMLKVAYPAIKEADPQAQVILGSLAYDWFTSDCDPQGHCGPFDQHFIDDVLDPGRGNAGAYFDLLGFHYYPPFRDRWEPYGTDVMGKANYLRSKLTSYGINKPLINTEISMWSSASHGGSDELQSDYVVQAYARGIAAHLGALVWFDLVDYNDWDYGLLESDLTPKPAYQAFKVITGLLSEARYVGELQLGGALSEGVEGYTFAVPNGGQRDVIWATGERPVPVTFTGSRLTVTDKYGTRTEFTDAGDGNQDGRVTISVTESPIYVDFAS